MAKLSIATNEMQSPSEWKSLGFNLGDTAFELTCTDAKTMMSDAYVWRAQVRGMLTLAEFVAEHAVRDPRIAHAIENTLGAARTLSELAEATLERACHMLDVDYDGTAPDQPEAQRA